MPVASDQSKFGDVMVGVIALLSGAAFPIHVLFLMGPPATTPLTLLSIYEKNQSSWAPVFYSVIGYAAVAIPTFAAVGQWLSPRSGSLARGAAYVTSAGFLTIAFGVVLSNGALIALAKSPSDAVYQPTAAFLAAFWSNMRDITDIFGQVLLGVGLLIFGRLAWRSHILPDWLAVVGVIGGVAGLISPFVAAPAILTYLAVTIWAFAFGAIVLERVFTTPR
jgi:hypothetical protein